MRSRSSARARGRAGGRRRGRSSCCRSPARRRRAGDRLRGADGQGRDEVLFSGQDDLTGLVTGAATWSLTALALLLVFKGLAWAISLAGFRGGPTFPAMFLGVAAGMMAAHLPGFDLTPAVAVGLGAAVAAVLRLPLSAVVLALMLTPRSRARGRRRW